MTAMATESVLPRAMPPPALPARGWLTLESPHFLIHFPPGQEQLARRVAIAAEDAHRNLVPKMQYFPEEKTHVVIADITDAANAFARVTPYNHITIHPVLPDTISYDTGLTPTHSEWFEQLLLHEYAHVLQLDMHSEGADRARKLFGKVPWAGTPNSLLGHALLEGHAVFAEGLMGNGRGDGAFYDMFLRAAVLENRIPPWDQVIGNYRLSGWNPGPAVYLYGYSFIDYLARNYGEDSVNEIFRLHSRQSLGANGVIKEVFQVPFDDLWLNWQHDLFEHYSQQREAVGSITAVETIPATGEMVLWPVWSPDGKAIVYGSGGNVLPSLRLRQTVGGDKERKLVNGLVTRSGGLSWTPDGQGVVYGKMDYHQGGLTSDLYIYNIRSGKEERLTHGYRAYAPTVSPDGEWIAFISRREDRSLILLTALEKGTPMVLWSPEIDRPRDEQPDQVFSLAWSPDGENLAFVGRTHSGDIELFLLPLMLQETPVPVAAPVRLTHDAAVKLDPSWSPDGRYLFFSSDHSGIYNIHAYDVLDGSQYQVTRALYGFFAPSVSPDGGSLLVSAYSADGYRMATLPLNPEEWVLCPPPAPAEPEIVAPADIDISEWVIRLPSDDAAAWSFVPKSRLENSDKEAWQELARPVDPQDFIIRPYRASESLTPRYWLPLWGGLEGQWLTGGSTSGTDALGQHAYALGISFGDETASYRTEYEYRSDVLGNGPVLGLSISGSVLSRVNDASTPQPARVEKMISPVPFLHSDGEVNEVWTENAGEFYIAWNEPGLLLSSSGVVWLGAYKDEGFHSELGLGIRFQGVGGDAHQQRVSDLQLFGVQGLGGGHTAGGLFLAVNQRLSERLRLLIDLSAVASTAEDSFFLGGSQGDLAIRGLPVACVRGQEAGKISIEVEYMAFPIQRGVQDSPVFVDGVSWALFCDSGIAGNKAEDFKTVSAVGAEARTTMTLGYGLTRGDLRLGLARSLDGTQPWRLYWGIGAGF
ncbi:MAG: hypothetical protein ACOYEP_00040 [Limnochordia bacterium]